MASTGKKTLIGKKSPVTKFFQPFFIFLILIVPQFYFLPAQDSALVPKLLIINIAFLLFTFLIIWNKRDIAFDFSVLKNSVFICLSLYALYIVSLLFFSNNPNEGLFDIVKTIITILTIFYTYQLFISNPEWFKKISIFIIISSLIAILTGLIQYINLLLNNPSGTLPSGEALNVGVTGFMANKNEYSSYLAFMLAFIIYSIFFLKGFWQKLSFISAFFTLLMIIFLASRGVWLGLIIAGSSVVFLFVLFRKSMEIGNRHIKKIVIISAVIIGLLVVGLLERGQFTQSSSLQKLGSIVRPNDDNNHFRLSIWKITSELTLEHSAFGVGPGNWQIEIPKYFKKIGLKGKEVNWITPHNDYLWIASEKGFIGIFLYLAVIISTFWLFFRIISSNNSREKKIQAVFLIGGLITYLIVACFGFPYQRIDQQILFAIFLSGLISLSYKEKQPDFLMNKKHFFYLPVLLFLSFGVIYSFQSLVFEMHIKKGNALTKEGKLREALTEINAAKTVFRSLDAKGSPADFYSGLIYDKMNDNSNALTSYLAANKVHPNHIAILNNIGRCYFTAGDLNQAELYYMKALEIVPDYKETRVNLSTLYYKKADYEKSLDMLHGLKSAKKEPAIKQNINALNKLLGRPDDSLKKAKKHQQKLLKKAKKQNLKKNRIRHNEN